MSNTNSSKKEFMKNFMFVITLVWQTSPKYLFAKIASAIANVVSSFVFVLFPKYIIDSIIEKHQFSHTLNIVFFMCALLVLIYCIKTYTDTYISKYSGIIQFDLVKLYGKKVMELNYDDLENPNIMNMFEKSKTGFDLYGFFDKLMSVATNILSLSGYVIILLTYNWIVLLIVLVVVTINLFCNKGRNKFYYEMNEEAAPINRKFSYLANLMLGFDYAKEIKVNDLSEYVLKKYDSNINIFEKLLTKIYRVLLKYNVIASIASLLQTFTIYAIVSFSALNGSITIGEFSMYTSAISAASSSMVSIVAALVDIGQNMKYATDMRLFFELERRTDNKNTAVTINNQDIEIAFENVSFKYPGTEKWILKNANFRVKKGEKISLVGKNGAGKTTIIKLLLRLYEPCEGTITLNNIDIKEYNYVEYLNLFAPVLQDYKIFAFTLQDNIILDREYDEIKLQKSIYESGLESKVSKLPHGLNTSIYKLFDENGVEFSGGENQKLAIARAIYKDSPIVLLDEPTANLDPIAEADIYEMMFNMLGDKTCFFVSHRLASSRFCNRIFVVDDGGIIADGTHKQLLDSCELYREMYHKQSQFYIDD